MNAAARVINQSSLFSGQLGDIRFSKQFGWVLTLLFGVFLSALAVVYTTNAHRMLCGQLQIEEQQAHQLHLQWGQLLLEQASLAAPGRVERLATRKLHMILPDDQQTFILRTE